MEVFVTVVNDFQPLTDVTKNSILDVKGNLQSARHYSYYYRYFSN